MTFPKPHMDRERWTTACRREGYDVDNVTKHTSMCSLHLMIKYVPAISSWLIPINVLTFKVMSLPDVC